MPPQCSTFDIKEVQLALDGGTNAQRDLVNRSTDSLLRKVKDRKTRAFVKATRTETKKLYEGSWTTVWTIPSLFQVCEASAQCVEISNAAALDAYSSATSRIDVLLKQVITRMKRAKVKAATIKMFERESARVLSENLRQLGLVPLSQSSCSGPDANA